MALSGKFHWVKVDRDHSPDLVRRFDVHAYPSLITIGDKTEKVHRFSGFKKPADFIAQLREALRRHALYREGKDWDEPLPRPETICSHGTVQSFPAPSEEVPSGLAFLGGRAWVAQGGALFQLDRGDGRVLRKWDLPAAVRDLCTDGKTLYAMEYGWTAGRPIHVVDPASGAVVREIVTESNKKNRSMGAAGIAWKDGRLWLLSGMQGRLDAVDPATGAITATLQTDARWLSGLAFDGKHFVAGGRKALHFIDPETGKVRRTVGVNYPLRVVAFADEGYHLMEQPVFGHDVNHKRVRIWPKRTVIYELRLQR